MKHLFLSGLFLLSVSLQAQNEQINTDVNMLGNQSVAVFANNNAPDVPSQQVIINTNKIQQFSEQHTQNPGQINVNINAGTRSSGHSETNTRNSKKIVHKKNVHVSSIFHNKLFDKKFKPVHHYKKKSRIKKCASF